MHKIAICGKANSGKDTIATILSNHIEGLTQKFAFADPIKQIVSIMYPDIPKLYLYGESKYRSEIIPNSYKNGVPLTIRDLLNDIGENGKLYNKNIWVEALLSKTVQSTTNVIVSDLRFINEFKALKENNFIIIKVKREDSLKIGHISNIEQDQLKDEQFDFIIDNNSNIDYLEKTVKNMLKNIII